MATTNTTLRTVSFPIILLGATAVALGFVAMLGTIHASAATTAERVFLASFNGAPEVTLHGVVLDQATMAPIEGAYVSLRATGPGAFTNADGTYTLTIPDSPGAWVVAAKKGFYNAPVLYTGSAGVSFSMEPTPSVDNASYAFVPPSGCSGCHPQQVQEWTGSPMARAGLNTWVHDIFSGDGTPGGLGGFVYLRDSVFAQSNPESECAACHQPELWIESPFSAMQKPSDPGYPSVEAVHGISCEVCHKIADVDVALINYPGVFAPAVSFVRPPAGRQVMYGLLGDSSYHVPGLMEAAFNPDLSAEVCGACHQDKNDPLGDHTFDGVTSEPTYLEWADSPYADPEADEFATCLSCHMPANGATSACVVEDPGRPFGDVRTHDIRGTTPEYLEHAAELVLDARVEGGELVVDVDVVNAHTGHHLPTGVTVRNMVLLVEASRAFDGSALAHTGDQVVDDLGGIGDPAQGYYAGLAGKFFAKVNMDAMGNGPTFFTDAAGIRYDNRIPALATDSTTYTFALPAQAGDVEVRARLIYRRAFRFLVDAKQWTEDGHGNPLADVTPPHYGHLMESAQTVVSVPVCPGDCDGSGTVEFNDLVAMLFEFGAGNGACDADGNGVVEFNDLVTALFLFGPCP